MKRNMSKKKLSLNKNTIVNLDQNNMYGVNGGGTMTCTTCPTFTCNPRWCEPTTACPAETADDTCDCPTKLGC